MFASTPRPRILLLKSKMREREGKGNKKREKEGGREGDDFFHFPANAEHKPAPRSASEKQQGWLIKSQYS